MSGVYKMNGFTWFENPVTVMEDDWLADKAHLEGLSLVKHLERDGWVEVYGYGEDVAELLAVSIYASRHRGYDAIGEWDSDKIEYDSVECDVLEELELMGCGLAADEPDEALYLIMEDQLSVESYTKDVELAKTIMEHPMSEPEAQVLSGFHKYDEPYLVSEADMLARFKGHVVMLSSIDVDGKDSIFRVHAYADSTDDRKALIEYSLDTIGTWAWSIDADGESATLCGFYVR